MYFFLVRFLCTDAGLFFPRMKALLHSAVFASDRTWSSQLPSLALRPVNYACSNTTGSQDGRLLAVGGHVHGTLGVGPKKWWSWRLLLYFLYFWGVVQPAVRIWAVSRATPESR